MAGHGNEAYDFELFEPKRVAEEVPQKKSNVIELPKEKLEQNGKSRPGTVKMVMMFLTFCVIAGIVGTFVYGQVQLAELSESLGTAQKALQEQQDIYTQMKIKSDSSLSMEAVETYASDKLGMKKAEDSQIVPVELAKGDRAEVVAKDSAPGPLERVWKTIEGYLS